MPTYGYTRVSTVDQVGGSSLEDQAQKLHGIAAVRGETISELYVEKGVSGSLPLEERKEGKRLMSALQTGDTLIVSKLDRAFRNATDALMKADLFKHFGVKLIIADLGIDPVTESGPGRMFFGMLALMAEFERDRILERTIEGRRAKRAHGGHIGGNAPFGFRKEGVGKEARLVKLPEEQAALKTIHSLRGRMSLRAVAAAVMDRHGIRVSHEAVRRIVGTTG